MHESIAHTKPSTVLFRSQLWLSRLLFRTAQQRPAVCLHFPCHCASWPRRAGGLEALIPCGGLESTSGFPGFPETGIPPVIIHF